MAKLKRFSREEIQAVKDKIEKNILFQKKWKLKQLLEDIKCYVNGRYRGYAAPTACYRFSKFMGGRDETILVNEQRKVLSIQIRKLEKQIKVLEEDGFYVHHNF